MGPGLAPTYQQCPGDEPQVDPQGEKVHCMETCSLLQVCHPILQRLWAKHELKLGHPHWPQDMVSSCTAAQRPHTHNLSCPQHSSLATLSSPVGLDKPHRPFFSLGSGLLGPYCCPQNSFA